MQTKIKCKLSLPILDKTCSEYIKFISKEFSWQYSQLQPFRFHKNKRYENSKLVWLDLESEEGDLVQKKVLGSFGSSSYSFEVESVLRFNIKIYQNSYLWYSNSHCSASFISSACIQNKTVGHIKRQEYFHMSLQHSKTFLFIVLQMGAQCWFTVKRSDSEYMWWL
jgi:hypothetical protein